MIKAELRMKTYKLITLCLASLFFGACNDGLDEKAGLAVTVTTNENVSYDGQIITVKKGTPIVFNLSGDPDFLTFFSGEEGYKYQYRNRSTIDPSQISSSTLDFSLFFQYGDMQMIEKHIYVSDEFPGLSKNNYENDSILVEQFEIDGRWKELVAQSDYPALNTRTPFSIDMTEYLGKNIAIAICYRGVNNTAVQPTMQFTLMNFKNKLKNGQATDFAAGSFGFTPLNMKNKWNLSDQTNMTADRQYGTARGISGIWNLENISNGTLQIQSSPANNPLKYSWLVSDLITINSCTPDQGTKLKDITQSLSTYTYTYNQVGIYNATFLARNANIDHSSEAIQNLVINVVE